jgi:hypothetical protein
VEPGRLRHGSTSSSTTPITSSSSRSGSGSGSRSGSERMQGSEPPPNRHERLNSTASLPEGPYGTPGLSRIPPGLSSEDSRMSPRTVNYEQAGPIDPHNGARLTSRRENGRAIEGTQPQLPSLSDMLDDGRPDGSDAKAFGRGFAPANPRRVIPDGSASGMPAGPISFRHEESSTGSTASSSSYNGMGRMSGEAPLPIHALLSSRAGSRPASTYSQASSPTFSTTGSIVEPGKPPMVQRQGPQGYGT